MQDYRFARFQPRYRRRVGSRRSSRRDTYKLQFDIAGYPDAKAVPFFPEIDPVFRVTDPAAHYHVPV